MGNNDLIRRLRDPLCTDTTDAFFMSEAADALEAAIETVLKNLSTPVSLHGGATFVLDSDDVSVVAKGAASMKLALEAIAGMNADNETDFSKLAALMKTVASATLSNLGRG